MARLIHCTTQQAHGVETMSFQRYFNVIDVESTLFVYITLKQRRFEIESTS